MMVLYIIRSWPSLEICHRMLDNHLAVWERKITMQREKENLEREGLDSWHDGNKFFQYEYATVDIAHQIKSISTFDAFEKFYTYELMDGNILLSEYLSELLERHKANAEVVSSKIGYSHDYVRKIAKGDRKEPSRDVLLAICAYIHATVEETQVLLRYAGQQPLYARRKRDAIIWFALKKGEGIEDPKEKEKDFEELNRFLHDRGYKTIWKA